MVTIDRLTEVALLRNFSQPYIAKITEISRAEECPKGTVLFRQGQCCPSIYIILSGEFSLQVEEAGGSENEVARLGRGELLGWSPVLGGRPMTATAKALTSANVAVLDTKSIQELCERDPRFGMMFLQEIAAVISDRLWATRRNFGRLLRHKPAGTSPEGSD